MEQLSRTRALIGDEAIEKLKCARVLLFGIGGVGSYTAEALVRAGIGALTVVDGDVISRSNVNRQLFALNSTVGMQKTQAAVSRLADVSADCELTALPIFYNADNADTIDFSQYDYVADAIDTVSSKLLIIEKAKKLNVPVISCMGTGNKLNANAFKVSDISKTSVCPLARVMRRELKARGIFHVKVVYSEETPVTHERVPASISFVPPCAGLLMAGEIIKDITGISS